MTPRRVGPVTAASTAGTALALVLVYVAGLCGLDVPEPVAGAVALLLTLAGGFLVEPAEAEHSATG